MPIQELDLLKCSIFPFSMIEHLTIEQFDFQEFPSGPVVRTLSFHCSEDPGSFPDQGTRILQLCGKTQKKKKKKKTDSKRTKSTTNQ